MGFMGIPGDFSATDAINSWYAECENPGYRWPAPNGCTGTDQFTQLVWKDTAEVGMTCDSLGKGFMFANFWPQGNMTRQYSKNVFPEGSPMQAGKLIRKIPFEGTFSSLTTEAEEVIESIPDEGIGMKILIELEAGRPVKLVYKPKPAGSLEYTFQDGMSGRCGV